MQRIAFVLLYLIASATSLTVLSQTRDSIVEVELSRLRSWAAKRLVSDTLIRELAGDFARQAVVIYELRKSEVQCDTIIDRQARLIGDWQEQTAMREEEIELLEKKRQRAKTLRWVERVGLLVGGFFIASQL